MRAITSLVVFLSMFVAPIVATAGDGGAIAVGLGVVGVVQAVKEDRSERWAYRRYDRYLSFLEKVFKAHEAFMKKTSEDRETYLAALTARVEDGKASEVDVALARVVLPHLAFSASHPGVGSLRVGRGAEFSGGFGYSDDSEDGGMGAGGGYNSAASQAATAFDRAQSANNRKRALVWLYGR